VARSIEHGAVTLADRASTGTGRKFALGFRGARRIAIEIVLESVGSVFTFTVQGLEPGGDDTGATAADWNDLAVVAANSATAATATPSVTVAAGRTVFYVDGLDKRFFDGIAVNVATNTGVTYRINAYPTS
jgi:hypothetical protein